MNLKTETDDGLMNRVLKQASVAIELVTNWRRHKHDTPHGSRFFTGDANGWNFVVCDFSIEEQGFPPGSRGADGAARHEREGVILHLTRELAETALALALAQEQIAKGG